MRRFPGAAIVGCGSVAQVHAKAICDIEGALLAAADCIPQRAVALTERYGGRPFDSLETMLDDAKPDVLHICTPHHCHKTMMQGAAERGVPVFCEKPPAINREEWAAFLHYGEKVPIGICFQNRYNPETKLLRQQVFSPDAGIILGARCFVTWQRDAAYYTDSGWRGKKSTEGGSVLINQAIHSLDLMVWILGRPEEVRASLHTRYMEGVIDTEDTAEVYFSYNDGKRALLYATTAHTANAPVLLEIVCQNRTVRLEDHTVTTTHTDPKRLTEINICSAPAHNGQPYWGAAHKTAIGDFYHSVEMKTTPRLSPMAVNDTMDTLFRIYESDGQ